MNISTKDKYAVEAMLYIAYFSGQGPLRVKVVAQVLQLVNV
ncbi:MAG: Rrf2 family transcriptional regulator [Candidatus Niameybacter stercoravium]|nr:Rrf2 family transcriptional regulator [Candidatus Niameybacter stercoravium]